MRTNIWIAGSLLALTGGLLAGCGNDPEPTAGDTSAGADTENPTPAPTSEAPSTPATTPPTSDAGSEPSKVAAPVYFVGDTPSGPRLYREFRPVGADDPLVEATELLLAGDALDPDYRTLLPALDVQSIDVDDAKAMIVVHVGEDSVTSDKATSPRDAKLAMQSLVYTLQGVTQTRDPVTVVSGPDDTPLAVLGIDTTDGVTAKPELAVLALVNVTSPEQGAKVNGTFTAEGVSSSFEATTPWEIRNAKGKKVLDGFATAEGYLDKLFPWKTDVDVSSLKPGTYTFAALTDDPSGGEGPGPTEDTKTITVK